MLWNPSLKKSFLLPKPKGVSPDHTIGFAFAPESNEYKIVRFTFEYKTEPAEIYELKTGSWRDLELGDYLFSYENVYCPQTRFNGILHWHARNLKKVSPTLSHLICSFDMKTEKFGAMMVPDCFRDDDFFGKFIPFTFRESLCLIDDTLDNFCDIWVMKEYGVGDSWEKLFRIHKEQHGLTCFHDLKHNGELLFGKVCSTGKTELVSFDCHANQVKNVGLIANGPVVFYDYNYVESLALIKSPNGVEIDEELRYAAESNERD